MPISPVTHYTPIRDTISGKGRIYQLEDIEELVGQNTLLKCIIQKESGWNINAIGDSGLAIGILQFHKSTFDLYAKKYNLEIDIYNPIDQINLAILMLSENPDNLYHWSVWKSCL